LNAAIAWGLLSALGYGATDFAARFSGRMSGVWRTMFYGQCAAFMIATVWLLSDSAIWVGAAADAPASAWGAAFGSALVLLGATAMLYRGLSIGRLSVVAPVAAGYGAVTAVLEAVAGGGVPVSQLAGLTFVVGGAALAALPPRDLEGRDRPSGLVWGLGAAASYGVGFWIQGTAAVPALGPALPLWIYYAVGPVALIVIGRALGQPLDPPRGRAMALAIATGLLAASGYLALVLGYQTGAIALVTVLSSLASAVTVLLARALIRERVSFLQWCGIFALVTGLGVIHAQPLLATSS
jgi:drug/metabolite transporter (DMT)-like permease